MREFQADAEQVNAAAAAIRAQHERTQTEAAELTARIRTYDLATGYAARRDLERAAAILPRVDLFAGAADELDAAGDDEGARFRAVRRLLSRAQRHLFNADLSADRAETEAQRTMVTTIEDSF